MSDKKKDDTPKKWYQKAWNGVKKGSVATYEALTSNTGALITSSVGLGLGIATGGVGLIAIGAVVLGVKAVKTGFDAAKSVKMRNLDMENKAIIDYAKTLCFKQIILDKQPKLQKIDKAVNSLDPSVSKKSKNEELKHNNSLETASKIVNLINAGLDITTFALDPTKGIHAIHSVKKAAETAEKIKSGIEVATSASEAIGAIDAVKELSHELGHKLSKHTSSPDIQKQMIDLINTDRKRSDVGYDNIQELLNQTQEMKNQNKAFVKMIGEKDPTEQLFKSKLENVTTPPEKTKNSIWQGIKDALNPYSQYNPNNHKELEADKHSFVTNIMRGGTDEKNNMVLRKNKLVSNLDLSDQRAEQAAVISAVNKFDLSNQKAEQALLQSAKKISSEIDNTHIIHGNKNNTARPCSNIKNKHEVQMS
jgi:hypothetical protein